MGGFQFLLILDLWDVGFHAVFGLAKNFLFKSTLGHCDILFLLFFVTIKFTVGHVNRDAENFFMK